MNQWIQILWDKGKISTFEQSFNSFFSPTAWILCLSLMWASIFSFTNLKVQKVFDFDSFTTIDTLWVKTVPLVIPFQWENREIYSYKAHFSAVLTRILDQDFTKKTSSILEWSLDFIEFINKDKCWELIDWIYCWWAQQYVLMIDSYWNRDVAMHMWENQLWCKSFNWSRNFSCSQDERDIT